jgi:nitrogen fixation protein NifU and related proteins
MSRDDMSELGDDLYREYILDHYQNPRNRGRLEPADIDAEGDNPTCGDQIHVTARIKPDGSFSEVRFEGHGCAISQASASILYEDILGKSTKEVLDLDHHHVEELIGITLRPARVKCAVLSLHVLRSAIQERQKKTEGATRVPGFNRPEKDRRPE